MSQESSIIVFLAGFGFKSSIWNKFVEYFSDYQIILVELPIIETDNINLIINHLVNQIPAQSIVIAWSLSGLFAIDLCIRNPQQFTKLVLLSSTPRFIAAPKWSGIDCKQINKFKKMLQSNPESFFDHFIKLIQYPNHSLDLREYLYKHLVNINAESISLVNYLDLILKSDCRDFYSRITIPILAIHGDLDVIIGFNNNATIIKQSGHISFLTHPQELVEHINRFLYER